MPTSKRAEAIRRCYATDRNLRIHDETHEKYGVPQQDFVGWTLQMMDWRGDETLLDIGTGRGAYYARLREKQPHIGYYALDLSRHMLVNHPAAASRLTLSDAAQLPYADGCFDVVMANHVLYYLADIDAGLREIKRVLKPGGRLLATTNSNQSLPELQVLIRRAIVLLSGDGTQRIHPPTLPSDPFALENGTRMLAQHFYAVVRHDLPGRLVFEELDPALEYIESMRDLRQDELPEDVLWDDMMMVMRQQISQLLDMLGKLELTKTRGALIASDSGGFIHEFAQLQNPRP